MRKSDAAPAVILAKEHEAQRLGHLERRTPADLKLLDRLNGELRAYYLSLTKKELRK